MGRTSAWARTSRKRGSGGFAQWLLSSVFRPVKQRAVLRDDHVKILEMRIDRGEVGESFGQSRELAFDRRRGTQAKQRASRRPRGRASRWCHHNRSRALRTESWLRPRLKGSHLQFERCHYPRSLVVKESCRCFRAWTWEMKRFCFYSSAGGFLKVWDTAGAIISASSCHWWRTSRMMSAWSNVALPEGNADSSAKKEDSTCSTASGRTSHASV